MCKYFRVSDVDLPTHTWPLSHWKHFSHLSPLTNKFLTNTLIVSNTHSYSYLIAALREMTITSAWQHARVEIVLLRFSHVIIEILPKILLDRSDLEKDIFCIPQWLWLCHFINFEVSWIQMRSQHYRPG